MMTTATRSNCPKKIKDPPIWEDFYYFYDSAYIREQSSIEEPEMN